MFVAFAQNRLKQQRVSESESNFDLFRLDRKDFLHLIVKME